MPKKKSGETTAIDEELMQIRLKLIRYEARFSALETSVAREIAARTMKTRQDEAAVKTNLEDRLENIETGLRTVIEKLDLALVRS